MLGLNFIKSDKRIPRPVAILAHVSPSLTRSNKSQFFTIPGRNGDGVAIPLPVVVVVGGFVVVAVVPPIIPTQTYVFAHTS